MRVLVVSGPSGGHIFPAQGFLDALLEKDKAADALLVLPQRAGLSLRIAPRSWKVKYIASPSISLSLSLKNLACALALIKSSLENLFLLLAFKPDIVVGFGSIDSVSLILLAWMLRIKTLIHEQNVLLGRANRLLAKFADKIAVSFVQTGDYLKIDPKKVVFTGNPLRRELKRVERRRALDFFGFSDDKLTLLVMGGSRSSHKINTCFEQAFFLMPARSKLQVIHIAGANDFACLSEKYQVLGTQVKLFVFLEQMQYAYSVCDLAVSRAGATSISELAFFELPAVIIPYPFAYKHQLNNAKAIEELGAAVIIEEERLDAQRLCAVLSGLIANPDKLRQFRLNYKGVLRSNSADLLAKEVLSQLAA